MTFATIVFLMIYANVLQSKFLLLFHVSIPFIFELKT